MIVCPEIIPIIFDISKSSDVSLCKSKCGFWGEMSWLKRKSIVVSILSESVLNVLKRVYLAKLSFIFVQRFFIALHLMKVFTLIK